MSENKIYGVTGLFNTPDEIIKASETIVKQGYKKFDVHTPYPVHGMNKAMNLPSSKLGYVALVLGLSGATFAFLFITWAMTQAYPNIIGGKPFFSFPAFIPVTFEVTVLSASIGTVLAMIVFMFKFPNLSHPLHDTDYMKSVSSDKYGICIEASDPEFNETEIKELLKGLGSYGIETVYFDNDEYSITHSVLDKRFLFLLIMVALITGGGTYFALNKLIYMTPFNWMMQQEKLNPQEYSAFFPDGFSMRTPVAGTIARAHIPLTLENNPDIYAKTLINPLPFDDKVIKTGKEKYLTYCSPCHGNFAEGDSRLNGQFPNPPSLHSDKVKKWTDGRIYYVIINGQNVMPSYSTQLNEEERWAVINYLRVLQRSLNAKESDLNE